MKRFAVTGILASFLVMALAAPAALAAQPEATVNSYALGDTTGMDWSLVPAYRFVPGDRLALNYGPRPDVAIDNIRDVTIRPDGRISVFPVGDVIAAGRTSGELEAAIVSLLSSTLRAPRCVVELIEAAGNQVHVMGEVKNPGSYKCGPFMTALQAISSSGGFQDDAARNSVIIMHRDGARTVRVMRLRADRTLKGDFLADVPLSRFDIVYVPRSTIGNLDVFVRQFFGDTQIILNSALVGWELFNLDRIYALRVVRQ